MTIVVDTIPAGPVTLRPFRADDLDDVVTACNDPLCQRYLPMLPRPYTPADGQAYLNEQAPGVWAAGGAVYAIANTDNGRLLGAIGLTRVSSDTGELGYWVAPWGRKLGAATSAARALTAWGFGHGFARLTLRTELENAASQRVAISAGYTREGVLRGAGAGRDGTRHDLLLWARLADDPPGPSRRLLPDLPGGQLTDRTVTLRMLRPEDADDEYALRVLPEVIATTVPHRAPERTQVVELCARAEAQWLAGTAARLSIRDTATGRFAGEIGLHYGEPENRQAMVRYDLAPQWRGRGYASRSVRLLAAWAFGHVGIARLTAGAAPDNLASQRVLAAVGFQQEGCQRSRLPGAGRDRNDDLLYSLLPTDL